MCSESRQRSDHDFTFFYIEILSSAHEIIIIVFNYPVANCGSFKMLIVTSAMLEVLFKKRGLKSKNMQIGLHPDYR